jgi:hypothetical protein
MLKYQIVFECIDGYKPMMPLQNSVKSFLAVRDTDAPKVNYGQNHQRRKRNESSSFLLSLPGVSAETDLEWPYNLIKYTLSLMMKTSHSCFKENSKAELGYELFKKTASLVMPLIKLEETWVPIKLPKECNRILEQKQLKPLF